MKKSLQISILLLTPVRSPAQVINKKTLPLEGAKQVIAAAVAEAKRLNAPGGVIAVMDDGGNLMALERLDNTFGAGANISIGKARTAVLFKRPTKVFEDIIKNGRTSMVALENFTPLQGGVQLRATPERARRELPLRLALAVPLWTLKGFTNPEVEASYSRALELCRGSEDDVQMAQILSGIGGLSFFRPRITGCP